MILLFVVNAPEFFLSHRLPIAIAAREAGLEVHVATGPGSDCTRIAALGFVQHTLPLSRSGRNPLAELFCFWRLLALMRRLRPEIVHLVTIKPILYGGIAARLARVPAVVTAISGLGTVFISNDKGGAGWISRGIAPLYRLALGHTNLRAVFQNPDDRAVLMDLGAVRKEQTVLIRGSGVNLAEYRISPEPQGVPTVSLAARLLKDKGILEFVEAVRILKLRDVAARFWLIGSPDPGNPSSVSEQEVKHWSEAGLIEVFGYRDDIPTVFGQSNLVVLPSYREGLPKVLIEAAACGRAVITTDVPGCRDAIEPGKTGLLVEARNPEALADAIETLLADPVRRQRMGEAGRALAERAFAIENVVDAHLKLYRELIDGGPL